MGYFVCVFLYMDEGRVAGKMENDRDSRVSERFLVVSLRVLDEVLQGFFIEMEKGIFEEKISLGDFLVDRGCERWGMREERERVDGIMGKGVG